LGQEIFWQSRYPFSQATIEVYKMDGSMVYKEQFLNIKELNPNLLNYKFDSGVYLLRFNSNDGYRRIKKLAILNK
jgi:hypothetical protein